MKNRIILKPLDHRGGGIHKRLLIRVNNLYAMRFHLLKRLLLLLRPKFPLINSGGVSGLSQPITFLFRQLLPSSQANDDHVRTHRVLID